MKQITTYSFASFALIALSVSVIGSSTGQSGSLVRLQAATPGLTQGGNINVSGTIISGRLGIGTQSPQYAAHVRTLLGSAAGYFEHQAGLGITSGISALTSSVDGRAVFAHATSGSGGTFGVYALSESTSGRGVLGHCSATSGGTIGVLGQVDSSSGIGVYGLSTATSGTTYSIYGRSSSSGGASVLGEMLGEGQNVGVYGYNLSTQGTGVLGVAAATSGSTYAVRGISSSPTGTAVEGYSAAVTGVNTSVAGLNSSVSGRGVYGYAVHPSGSGFGGLFECAGVNATALRGNSLTGTGNSAGIFGSAASPIGVGLYATNTAQAGNPAAIIAQCDYSPGFALYAIGRMVATGTKNFIMDHPLDPENKLLYHFCTEAAEPLNTYSGTITSDESGYATVQLPDYFDEINKDVRYQLTVIDTADKEDFVLAKVVRKVEKNRFVIRTSSPNTEVSWRVEATRNDAWVRKHGYETESEKSANQKGRYVNPDLYDKPESMRFGYQGR